MPTNYNDQLTANNAKIDSIKAKVDALPDAGGGGGDIAKLVGRSIQSISDPSVTFIGNGAFMGCHLLQTANFPNANYIGDSAFSGCGMINVLSFPSVAEVETYAFVSCESLTELTFGNKLERLWDQVFRRCGSLVRLTIKSPAVCQLDGDLFAYAEYNPGLSIYVPANLVDQYKAATNWAQYADKIFPIPEGGI